MARDTTDGEPRAWRPWEPDEVNQALAWRARTPPMPFTEIGKRLGGRTARAVVLKLLDKSLVGVDPAPPEAGEPLWPGEARDEQLFKRCQHDGGFSAYSTYQLDPVHRPRLWGFCHPIIDAFGKPRPEGWKDGDIPSTAEQWAYLRTLRDKFRSAA